MTLIAPTLGFFVKLVSGRKPITNATESSILVVTMALDTSQCFFFSEKLPMQPPVGAGRKFNILCTFNLRLVSTGLFRKLFKYVQSNKDSLKIMSR